LQLAYYSPFCPKFHSHCNEGQSGKNSIGSIRWPIHKTPFRCKNLADISWQWGSVGEKCNWQHSMAHPQKTPIGAKISYASRVIANFVPNFVAMATGVDRGKIAIGSIRWPILENPPIGAKISYARRVIANFVPNFVAVATREGPR